VRWNWIDIFGSNEALLNSAGTPGFQLISTLSHLSENRSVGIRNNETRMVGESLTFAQVAVVSGRRPWTNYQLRTRLRDFVDAYNLARRLKTQIGLNSWRVHLQAMELP
jgi:hypothetical protein